MESEKQCNNHIRGCKEILDIKDKYNYCLKCRAYRRDKEKNLRETKKNNAKKFNIENIEKKMCYKCNKIDNNDKFMNQKCYKCYQQMEKIENNRKSKNPYKERYQTYKNSEKKRNIKFLLSENEFLSLVIQNCYYCNTKSISSIPNGIDRIDSKKCYYFENCVPCCKYCNFVKGDKTIEQFKTAIIQVLLNQKKILEYNEKLQDVTFFKKRQEACYKKFISELKYRKLKNFLTEKDYYNMILNKCYYCGLFPEGCNGIDRIDSSKSYFKDNCVPCCWTCNIMKNTNENFIEHLLNIYKFYIIKEFKNNNVTLEDKIKRSLSNINSKFKRQGIDKFLYPDEYYYNKIWNGDYNDYLKLNPKMIFCESKEEKDIWMFYRRNISSFKLFNKRQYKGRQILILVQDIFSEKYLGIIGISDAYKNIKFRDNYIDWDFETRNKKLNYIMNISTCVPLQPFGYNFAGGKLLVKMVFSNEVHQYIENKYKINLIGLETYGLFGKSNMYDGLKEIKYLGLTEGNSYYKFDNELIKDCKYFLEKNEYNLNTNNKFIILNRICELLKLPKDIIFRDNQKGIYFGYFNTKNKLFLNNKIDEIIPNNTLSYKEKFYEWRKTANNRFFFLKNKNKLKKIIPKNNLEKTKTQIKLDNTINNNTPNLYKKNVKTKISENKQKNTLKKYIEDKKNNIKIKKENKKLPTNFSFVYTNLKSHIYFDKKYDNKRYTCKRQIKTNDIDNELAYLIRDIKIKYKELPFKLPDIKNKILEDKYNESFILPKNFTELEEKGLKYILFQKTFNGKRYAKKHRIKSNLEFEYNEFIKKLKVKCPELQEYFKSLKEEIVLPKYYSISKINDDEYLTFNQRINGKRYCKRKKIGKRNIKDVLEELQKICMECHYHF